MNQNLHDTIKARRDTFDKCFQMIADEISTCRFDFEYLIETLKVLIEIHRAIMELDNILIKKGDTP